MHANDASTATLLWVAIAIVVFLVLRELICWYWKINQGIALLTEIRNLLAANAGATGASAPSSIQSLDHPNVRPGPSASMIPANEYAESSGMTTEQVVQKLRSGDLTGRQIDGGWFVAAKP